MTKKQLSSFFATQLKNKSVLYMCIQLYALGQQSQEGKGWFIILWGRPGRKNE